VKITKLSLAAIAAMTLTTGAMADVDFKTSGQAVVYYQTMDAGAKDIFAESGSAANAGIQLNFTGDLGNDFSSEVQASALNTFGLEGNLVNGVMQSNLGNNGDATTAGDYFAITKANFSKKVGDTKLTLGRQELPKSLSPFAFTEGWNVFKNTFDAAVAVNANLIPDTTLVGAYVSKSNSSLGPIGTFTYINPAVDSAGQGKGVYMLTAQNKSINGLTPTLSYYQASSALNAVWLDLGADLNKLAGVPVKVSLQGGQVSLNASGTKDNKAMGAKVSAKTDLAMLTLAYSKTNNGSAAIHNLGTGVKTPLYTQMILNQVAIKNGADTVMLKAVAPVSSGKLIAQYAMTTANAGNNFGKDNDYQELDLIYKFKALGTNVLAAYVMQKTENKTGVFTMNGDDTNNVIRLWTRYNF
jgi:hypothetical protein